MSRALWTFFLRGCLWLFSLRYKVKVKGVETLPPDGKGMIFLPNHPALIDPVFLYLLLWPKFRMRPLVVEYVFRLPFLKSFMRLIRAIAVPNFESSVNQLKVRRIEASIQQVVEGLKRGENFVLYPGRQLKSSGKEVLGGASGAHTLVQAYPQAQLVLVRTTGLWGSIFSQAFLGRTPEVLPTFWQGIKILLKNGIFFAPRREVTLEIEYKTDVPRTSRLAFNRYLESWYNQYPDEQGQVCEEEPLKLVPHYFWSRKTDEPYRRKERAGIKRAEISEEISAKIYEEIRHILESPELKITPEMNLSIDLGMDSLNVAELVAYLMQNYEIEELHPEEIETVQDALEVAEGAQIFEKKKPTSSEKRLSCPKEEGRPVPLPPFGNTFQETFLHACERMGGAIACGDDLMGVLSYKKLKRTALVLALHFQKIPELHVAVLFPASVAAYLVILALQFAGKIPVMLNWTLGPRYLDEMMAISGAKRTITSWRFLDRLSQVDLGKALDQVELLEDIRNELRLRTKLKGALLAFLSKAAILRTLKLDRISEDQPAVILFTSGTEASPKGVPLSHKNILSNQKVAVSCIELHAEDTLFGILPPFHSFGFSVAGLLPLFAGLRIVYFPDPTDSVALAEGIARWKITLFCGAPSFLKGLLRVAKKEQLKTVRLFVTGAEKAPAELFKLVEELGTSAQFIEGYGITECAPMLSMHRLNVPRKGVGHPFPGIELCTIHPESLEPLKEGKEGEICVRGPNIFDGYLGSNRQAFIEIEGKRWYRTGDLGYLDTDGTLVLSGRLKRFTKIGGEMISLGAIEEVLTRELIRQGALSPDVPSLAVCAHEEEGHPVKLILFTAISLGKEQVNEILKSAGFSSLVKISSVKRVEEIPLLGVGKTDYRSLQQRYIA